MNSKNKLRVKGSLSLVLMTLSFFMMIQTKYFNSLGDLLLEFIGLNSWSNGDSGFHLTVIYFGILFIIGIVEVNINVIRKMNIKKSIVLIYSIVLILIYYTFFGSIFTWIKSDSEGLLSIFYYNTSDSYIEYSIFNETEIDFQIQFELKNYSDEEKSFSIQVFDERIANNESKLLRIYKKSGELGKFYLGPKESKLFKLTSEEYELKPLKNIGKNTGYSRLSINNIVLEDYSGKKVFLDEGKFFGRIIE